MHTCPECGQACTCNGDIDDIMFDDGPEALACVHDCDVDDSGIYDGFEDDD
jgi:hypothetical protein